MSLTRNQIETLIYQLVRKLHENDLISWYIKNHPHDFEYLENGELGYYNSLELVSLVKLENNFDILFDKRGHLFAFLDQLIEDAVVVKALATESESAFRYYLGRIENL